MRNGATRWPRRVRVERQAFARGNIVINISSIADRAFRARYTAIPVDEENGCKK